MPQRHDNHWALDLQPDARQPSRRSNSTRSRSHWEVVAAIRAAPAQIRDSNDSNDVATSGPGAASRT
ncbi:hypothetical protein GCM10023317_68380 [Actinopolymorpha pittospori]